MNGATRLETMLRRDRVVVMGALGVIAGLAWAYIGYLAWEMQEMGGGSAVGIGAAMPRIEAWNLVDLVTLFVMWSVMMVAMMLPAVSGMLLAFATINRRRRERHEPDVATAVFLCGYLLVWVGFSVLATLVQWGLQSAALLSPMMAGTSPILGGTLLIAAGIFQWTPLKDVCLAHCRSPMSFILSDWREGIGGAVLMGLHHGAFCVGCCWALMGLLFVVGVMNLLWVAAPGGTPESGARERGPPRPGDQRGRWRPRPRFRQSKCIDLLGFPRELCVPGTPFANFIRFNAERGEYGPGDVEEIVREHVERAKRREPHHFERTCPDGSVIEVRGTPLPGRGFVATYTYITDWKMGEDISD